MTVFHKNTATDIIMIVTFNNFSIIVVVLRLRLWKCSETYKLVFLSFTVFIVPFQGKKYE